MRPSGYEALTHLLANIPRDELDGCLHCGHHALVNRYLGTAYALQGDYHQAIDCLRQTIAAFDGVRRHERFGLPCLPSSRAPGSPCAMPIPVDKSLLTERIAALPTGTLRQVEDGLRLVLNL